MKTSWANELFADLKRLPQQEALAKLLLLAAQLPETASIEFKRPNQLEPHGALAIDDARNIARCLSGFANSLGGLVVIGFEDGPRNLAQITEIAKYEAAVRTFMGYAVEPNVRGVELLPVMTTQDAGVLLMLIPESFSGPHQIVGKAAGTDQYRYLKRIEGRFAPMTHSEVRASFQKRLGACLQLNLNRSSFSITHSVRDDPITKASFSSELWIQNVGSGHARHIYGRVLADFSPMNAFKSESVELSEFILMEHWELGETRSLRFSPLSDPGERKSSNQFLMFDSVPWLPPTGSFYAWHLAFTAAFKERLTKMKDLFRSLPPISVTWMLGAEFADMETGSLQIGPEQIMLAIERAEKSDATVKSLL